MNAIQVYDMSRGVDRDVLNFDTRSTCVYIHASAAFMLIPVRWVAGWASEPVWILWTAVEILWLLIVHAK
jgi:hypothetical protein